MEILRFVNRGALLVIFLCFTAASANARPFVQTWPFGSKIEPQNYSIGDIHRLIEENLKRIDGDPRGQTEEEQKGYLRLINEGIALAQDNDLKQVVTALLKMSKSVTNLRSQLKIFQDQLTKKVDDGLIEWNLRMLVKELDKGTLPAAASIIKSLEDLRKNPLYRFAQEETKAALKESLIIMREQETTLQRQKNSINRLVAGHLVTEASPQKTAPVVILGKPIPLENIEDIKLPLPKAKNILPSPSPTPAINPLSHYRRLLEREIKTGNLPYSSVVMGETKFAGKDALIFTFLDDQDKEYSIIFYVDKLPKNDYDFLNQIKKLIRPSK